MHISVIANKVYAPGYHVTVGQCCFEAWTTWRRENSSTYRDSNSDPWVVQPVASPYTDYAIPAPLRMNNVLKLFIPQNRLCI
jgi:hypothetical protein